MDKTRTRKLGLYLLMFIVVLTLVQNYPVSVQGQETPSITLNRYGVKHEFVNGTNRLWSSINPQNVKHYNSNEFTDFVYEDHYSQDGFLLVQTSMISVQVYDWYTVFYDPDHDLVCVDDERWLVEVYGKNKKWREVDLYDVTLSSIVNDTHATITRSISGSEGILNVSYVLSASNTLKHDVTFQSLFEEQEIFMVVYKLTGIHGSLFACPEGSFLINQTTNLKTSNFVISNGSRNMLYEDLRQVINETNTIEIDSHSSGSKVDVYIGNYSLNPLETIHIDPDSDTWEVTASARDSFQDQSDTWYNTDTSVDVDTNYFGSDDTWGGTLFQDIGNDIDQDETITEAYCIIQTGGGADDPLMTFYGEDVATPESFGSGTTDINDRTRTSASVGWDEQNIGSGEQICPDITTIIQELVNRGDWGSGDDIGILWIKAGNPFGERELHFASWDNISLDPPQLYIEWGVVLEERSVSAILTSTGTVASILTLVRGLTGGLTITTSITAVTTFIKTLVSSLVTTTTVVAVSTFIKVLSVILEITSTISSQLSLFVSNIATLIITSSVVRQLALFSSNVASLIITTTVSSVKIVIRGLGDILVSTTSVARLLSLQNILSQTLTLTSSVSRQLALFSSNVASLVITTTVGSVKIVIRGLSVILQSSTSVSRLLMMVKGLTANLTITSTVASFISIFRSLVASLVLTSTVSGVSLFIRGLSALLQLTTTVQVLPVFVRGLSSILEMTTSVSIQIIRVVSNVASLIISTTVDALTEQLYERGISVILQVTSTVSRQLSLLVSNVASLVITSSVQASIGELYLRVISVVIQFTTQVARLGGTVTSLASTGYVFAVGMIVVFICVPIIALLLRRR